ncbi:MAG: VIT domain-containing protein [Planctomycetota bacterium]|nr:VIT domain-containing protein [Planctomycetota bacterium]
MNNWSDEARNELERFLVAERGWLALDPESVDVDHEEVIADLRAHVREELVMRGDSRVELEQLHAVLQRLRPGFGSAEEQAPSPGGSSVGATAGKDQSVLPSFSEGASTSAGAGKARPATRHSSPTWFATCVVFGVLLPALALFIEMSSHTLANEVGFDPIPELHNVLLIGLVPVMNLVLLLRDPGRLGRVSMALAGSALTVTILYSILFLPLVPLGVIAIVFLGFGFLILSPQLSLLVTATQLRRCRKQGAPRGALVGSVLTMLLLGASAVPAMVTDLGADWATDADPAVRERGLGLLRSVGSEEQLLRYCYGASNNRMGSLVITGDWLIDAPSQDQARELYFLVTGAPFNSVDPPKSVLFELEGRGWDANAWRQRNTEERARGGNQVAGRIEQLDLVESRIDVQIEAEAALFYLEWELEFGNDSDTPQEARAQVQLPPGSYVSRLTLWVNGEEREAAFDETGKVRQAYQEVAVVQRRDPVLVTHSGTDQVLVQCFPVPAQGKLRTRIGITAPLLLAPVDESLGGAEGTLCLPRFLERNFGLAPALEHEIWLQGRGDYLALPGGLVAADPGSGQLLARGSLPAAELDAPTGMVRVSLERLVPQAWAYEGDEDSDHAVLQTLEPVARDPIDRLVVVLDGGTGLEQAGQALAFALDFVPAEVELGLIVAGGGPTELESPGPVSPSRLEALGRVLAEHDFTGGVNAAPSLVAAFDLAQEQPGGAVVWLHGGQPVTLSGTASLEQRLERSGDTTRIHALAAAPGINRLVAEYGHHPALSTEPRTGALTDDLVRLLRELTVGAHRFQPLRQRVAVAELPSDAQSVSKHLARLWAGDEASALQAIPKDASRRKGVQLAKEYHLVTPRTGAVVLETQAQFDRHGLKPVTIDEVPSVPEPEMIALLLLVGALLGFALLRGRAAA